MRHRICALRCCYHSGVCDTQESTGPADLRTVFLDRDGVINEKMPEGRYVASWSDFHLLPGVPEAIARLNRAGLRVIVVSNQRGIALGYYTCAAVNGIHERLQGLLKSRGAQIDAFYYCPHDKNACTCRKPNPGLFEQAAARFGEIEAASSVMIGDSLSDVEFGRRLGMRTVFLEGSPDRRKPGGAKASALADLRCQSLPDAVEALLTSRSQPR